MNKLDNRNQHLGSIVYRKLNSSHDHQIILTLYTVIYLSKHYVILFTIIINSMKIVDLRREKKNETNIESR